MTDKFDRMTTGDIAKLAGVEVSTVSNWRKRYREAEGDKRFPAPIDENTPRPAFRGSEVRRWLRQQDPKYAALLDEAEKSGRATDAVRSWRYALNPIFANSSTDVGLDELTVMFIATVQGGNLRYDKNNRPGYTDLSITAYSELVNVTIPDEAAENIKEFFEFLDKNIPAAELVEAVAVDLEQSNSWRRSNDAVDAGANLRSLLAGLVNDEAENVLDLCCGTGARLRTVATTKSGRELVGIEENWEKACVADARLLPYAAEILDGDILTKDLLNDRAFDAVLCVPPFGRELPRDTSDLSRRMRYGRVRSNADAAWPQLAANALRPGGEAYLVLPQGLTSSTKADAIRRELIRQGLISAVVSLPPAAHTDTRTPTDLWVLRQPDRASRRDRVLFIDASAVDPTRTGAYEQLGAVIRSWQSGGDPVPADLPTAAVTAIDLMDQTVSLAPRYWVARGQPAADPGKIIAAVADTLNNANQAVSGLAGITLTPPPLQPGSATMINIQQLRDEDLIKVLRPDIYGPKDQPEHPRLTVTVAEEMRAGTYQPATNTWGEITRDDLTAKDDVLIWASPQDRRVRATVCRWAGLQPTGSVEVIRCHGINARYLALLVESSRNAALVSGSTIVRAQIMDLDLPYVTPAQADTIASTTQALDQLQAHAREVLAAVEQARQALSDTLGTGQIEINDDHQPHLSPTPTATRTR